jgi:hypothetical protein
MLMSSIRRLANLLESLRTLGSPETLPGLAVECRSLATNTSQGGILILAHAALLSLAAASDDGLEEPEWDRIKRLSGHLADLIEFGATGHALASFAYEWTDREEPRFVH